MFFVLGYAVLFGEGLIHLNRYHFCITEPPIEFVCFVCMIDQGRAVVPYG